MTDGPQWALKFDRGPRAGADGWSILGNHLVGEKKDIIGCVGNVQLKITKTKDTSKHVSLKPHNIYLCIVMTLGEIKEWIKCRFFYDFIPVTHHFFKFGAQTKS